MIGMARQSAQQRVAHLLIDLFVRVHGHSPRAGEEMHLPLTQVRIGDALGLTAIHVNRMLGQLRLAGAAVVRRRKLRILSPARLLALAESGHLAAPKAREPKLLPTAA